MTHICQNKSCEKQFETKKNSKNLYCSRDCVRKDMKNVNNKFSGEYYKSKNVESYNKNPKLCKNCNKPISYERKANKFCNHSCAASLTSKGRIPSNKQRKKASEILTKLNIARYKPRNNVCVVCFGEIIYEKRKLQSRQTCGSYSSNCYKKYMSNRVVGKTGGSTKQFIEFSDSLGNKCSLDSSWELIIANELNNNNVQWSRPKSFLLKNGRRYTPDFYLIEQNVYVDPKAYRKGYMDQVAKIKLFEQEYKTKCIIISDDKLLTWDYIKSMI